MNEADDELEGQAGKGGNPSIGPGEVDLSEDEDEELDGPGLHGAVSLSQADLPGALEALILVSDKPIPAVRLARLTRQDLAVVKDVLNELQEFYRGRGLVLDEIAGGFQFRSSVRYAPFVRNLVQQKPVRLSRAQLEVLAIIAYRQPVTRPEIEDVRGVDSGSAIKVLLERNVIKIIGKKDDAGRPMLYGTSTEFLELFGLKSLRDLPTLKEFAELTPESRDIYERRIGEPVPDAGMNLGTTYEAKPSDESDGGERAEGDLDGDTDRPPEDESDGERDTLIEDAARAALEPDGDTLPPDRAEPAEDETPAEEPS